MTNVNQLNRNIESVAVVGSGFEPVHKLWKEFEAVMANAKPPSTTVRSHVHFVSISKLTCVLMIHSRMSLRENLSLVAAYQPGQTRQRVSKVG